MAVEDVTEEERRETHEKLDMLQSVVRTFELKAKNAQDHSKDYMCIDSVSWLKLGRDIHNTEM